MKEAASLRCYRRDGVVQVQLEQGVEPKEWRPPAGAPGSLSSLPPSRFRSRRSSSASNRCSYGRRTGKRRYGMSPRSRLRHRYLIPASNGLNPSVLGSNPGGPTKVCVGSSFPFVPTRSHFPEPCTLKAGIFGHAPRAAVGRSLSRLADALRNAKSFAQLVEPGGLPSGHSQQPFRRAVIDRFLLGVCQILALDGLDHGFIAAGEWVVRAEDDL